MVKSLLPSSLTLIVLALLAITHTSTTLIALTATLGLIITWAVIVWECLGEKQREDLRQTWRKFRPKNK